MEIALAVPLSAAPAEQVQAAVREQMMEMSRAVTRLSTGWGSAQAPKGHGANRSGR